MNKQIFLNIPVADLPKSMSFYQALGYSLNSQFTGDSAACVVINETTFVKELRFRGAEIACHTHIQFRICQTLVGQPRGCPSQTFP